MMRFFLFSLMILFLFPSPGQGLQFIAGRGALHIRGEYRSIAPGELMKVTLAAPGFRKAFAAFGGSTFEFSGKKGKPPFVLVGIDPETPPGTRDLSVTVEFSDGSEETLTLPLTVEIKSFRQTALDIHSRFIEPSVQEEEKIRRDRVTCRTLYQAGKDSWQGRGDFILPVEGGIGKNFGDERLFNGSFVSRHRGIDITAEEGTPVKAANSGRVVLAEDLFYGGKTVIIDHGKGLFTVYCHLSKLDTSAGKRVRKGKIIGWVGATGRATGPHLHWGMSVRGTAVDPLSAFALSFP